MGNLTLVPKSQNNELNISMKCFVYLLFINISVHNRNKLPGTTKTYSSFKAILWYIGIIILLH